MHHELLWSTNVGKQKAEKKCSGFMWGYYYCTVMMDISDIDGQGLIGLIFYDFRYFTLNVTVPSVFGNFVFVSTEKLQIELNFISIFTSLH